VLASTPRRSPDVGRNLSLTDGFPSCRSDTGDAGVCVSQDGIFSYMSMKMVDQDQNLLEGNGHDNPESPTAGECC
jgi:hypothetical protein